MANKKIYFIHNLPGELPSNYDGCFVRARIGVAPDPNIDTYWQNTRYLQRGLYQFPKPTAENDVHEHVSTLIESTWYYGAARWVVLCALYVDLQFINTWVGRMADTAFRPVIYTTYDHWNAILKGDNVESVALTILNKADLCMSKYGVKAPVMPRFASKLKFWEYEGNKIYWNEEGLECDSEFQYLDEPGSTPDDPDDPDTPPANIPTMTGKWKSTFPPLWSLLGGEVIHEPINEE